MDYSLYDYCIKIFKEEGDPDFGAAIEEILSCSAFGATPQEALKELEIAYQGWLETMKEHQAPIPVPYKFRTYSGKFNVRIPKSMHKKLAEKAERDGASLNQEVIRFLAIGMEHEEKSCTPANLQQSA